MECPKLEGLILPQKRHEPQENSGRVFIPYIKGVTNKIAKVLRRNIPEILIPEKLCLDEWCFGGAYFSKKRSPSVTDFNSPIPIKIIWMFYNLKGLSYFSSLIVLLSRNDPCIFKTHLMLSFLRMICKG